MNELLAKATAAPGGPVRWQTFEMVTATVVAGGGSR